MKKKVLLVTEILPHYRVPLFNMLSEKYILTVAHGDKILDDVKFFQKSVRFVRRGPFILAKQLPEFAEYDVVILTFNVRILNFMKFMNSKRKYRLLLYGIGVSASYNKLYDQDRQLDWLRKYWIKKSDGAIFYESYPTIKYPSPRIAPSKLYVAYNTVVSSLTFNYSEKEYLTLLFLGTLYKQKKIYDLLDAYKMAFFELDNFPKLEIVGNGPELQNIIKWIADNELKEKIVLHGAVNNVEEISLIMKRAMVCISPGQAGLTVQNCFSYGVPFVTTKTAITGGELFSIIDNVNGFFYDGSVGELSKLLKQIAVNQDVLKECSRNAYEFYHRFRTPEIWLNGFINAIG